MDQTLEHSVTISHTKHPLSTVLRECMIAATLQAIDQCHQNNDALGQPFFGGLKAKGLCVRGSATLPANLRQAGDIDMTINMPAKYDPDAAEKGLRAMLDLVGQGTDMQVHVSDMSTHSAAHRAEWLHKEKKFLEVHLTANFSKDEVADIREHLTSLFNFTDKDLKALDDFGPETIAAIVAMRKKAAEKAGKIYVPTPEEEAGTGLSESITIDITLKDRLNIFAPYTMGTMTQALNGRGDKTPFQNLTFSNPFEEVSDKILALLTNKERARVDEPHAKDLLDIYLRTREDVQSQRAWCPFIAERKKAIDMVRVCWPMRPTFHSEPELYFKKIDPELTENVRQIKNGLLKLQEHGYIGEAAFGEVITDKNAAHYAKIILDHSWALSEECFGVKREGTHNTPVYSLHPPEKVKAYWNACRKIAHLSQKPVTGFRNEHTRADFFQRELETKINTMLESEYEDVDRRIVCHSGATNALVRADPTRQWIGYVGATR